MAATTKSSSMLVNPSKPSASTPPTSMGPRQKAAASPRPKSQNETKPPPSMQEANVAGKHAHDRLTFLMANFVGCVAYVTVKNGDRFSGIFSGAMLDSPESQYVLKMSKKLLPTSPQQQPNGANHSSDDYLGYGDDHVMTFDVKDVIDLNVPNVTTAAIGAKLTNGASFRTDTDISGNLAVRERELQRWEPAADTGVDLSMNGSSRGWDQFETNERLYGVKTSYDENFYTTSIDRSHPTYKQRAARAEQLAREIEGTATLNAHVAEERNITIAEDDHVDEEERYSGVKRDFSSLASSQPGKYTPPAMRPPTGQPTVSGAPVDPAIISSQLVRPDSSSSKPPKGPSAAASSEAAKENTNPSDIQAGGTLPATDASKTEENTGTDKHASRSLKPLAASANMAVPRDPPQPLQTAPNATANVEHQVADAFRTFAASEKLKMQEKQREKQRQSARKEREVRLNDLKKFSANFKLHTAVPEDILGILAKDKAKQVEIVGKAQQDLEQQRRASLAQSPPVAMAEAPDSRAAIDGQQETSATPAGPAGDRMAPKGSRNNQITQNFRGGKGDRNSVSQNMPLTSPRAPGALGERLMAQQQLRGGRGFQNTPQSMGPPDPRMMQQPNLLQQQPPAGPLAATNSDASVTRQSGVPTPNSALPRFNAQASEFKPNPTATTFLPGAESSASTSPSHSRAQARKNAINRVSFFGEKKPGNSTKKSISDGFNPIARMKAEVIEAGKTKDYAANGGIPQAYRTPPTWEAGKGNEEKSYTDMFETTSPSLPSVSPGSYAMAHQHQLPPHLQQGTHVPTHMSTPQQYRMHPNAQPRDNYFDDHRMHPSSSQQSSVGPSPNFRQPMLAYPPQMGGPMQPQFVQNVGQFQMGPNGQPLTPMRQFSQGQFMSPQGGPMSSPMMANHSNNGQFIGLPVQGQMPMYASGGQQVFPAQVSMGPGQGALPSPRPGAQVMVPQGSQGHYMMAGPSQQGVPGGFVKHHPNQMPIRGGVPMMQQGSYGSSPHLQHHFPAQQRGAGPQFGGAGMNYQYPQMHPGQMMQYPQQHMPTASMRRASEQSDAK